MQEDFNNYGEDAFMFVPMILLDDGMNQYKAERIIVDKYREEGFSLYNYLRVKKTVYQGKETLQPLDVDLDIIAVRKQLEEKS
jgi:hypothetical protein